MHKQASGENILAAALHFTHILSRNSEAPSLQTNDVFYDILGRYMVRRGFSWASAAAYTYAEEGLSRHPQI